MRSPGFSIPTAIYVTAVPKTIMNKPVHCKFVAEQTSYSIWQPGHNATVSFRCQLP